MSTQPTSDDQSFEELYQRLTGPTVRAAAEALFNASDEELAKAFNPNPEKKLAQLSVNSSPNRV